MSLVSTQLKSILCNNDKHINTLHWVLAKIDCNKLISRVRFAHNNPDFTVKCVLLEYAYTSRAYGLKGNPNIIEYMPRSNVLVHHALQNPDFVRLSDELFKNQLKFNLPNTTIYCRQKIKSNGFPDFHRKQLVIAFTPNQ